MGSRAYWVDYAKAIGIILVVYGHVARGLYNAGLILNEQVYSLIDSVIYSFHMPLFFFLSGLFFFDSFKKKKVKGLVLSKVDTVVYPYFLWSILQGIIEVFMSSVTNGNASFSELLKILWEPRAQFWFLYALFFIFLLSSIIFRFIRIKFVLIVFLLSVLLYVVCSYYSVDYIPWWVSNNFVFFVLGVVFKYYSRFLKFDGKGYLIFLLVLFFVVQYVFHCEFEYFYTDKGWFSLLVSVVSIFVVVVVSKALSKRPNNFVLFIGASSMGVYLMHIMAGSGARILLVKYFSVSDVFVHAVTGVILGLSLPLLVVLVVKKYKIPLFFSAPISKCFLKKSDR